MCGRSPHAYLLPRPRVRTEVSYPVLGAMDLLFLGRANDVLDIRVCYRAADDARMASIGNLGDLAHAAFLEYFENCLLPLA